MNERKLDAEEKDFLESYEAEEWRSIDYLDEAKDTYSEYARRTFKKDKRVNIRISRKDLEAIQKRALEDGLPYQTLISSVLHNFVNGRFTERTRVMYPIRSASIRHQRSITHIEERKE